MADNVDHPLGAFLYAVSCMHCMTVSRWPTAAWARRHVGEQTARRMLAEAGFTSVAGRHVEDDILNSYYIARK